MGEFTGPSFAGLSNYDVQGLDLDLSLYPLLKLVGIGGKLVFGLQGQKNDFDLEADIKNGNLSGGYKIQGIFTVPEIENFTLSLNITGKSRFLTLKRFVFNSSLGEIKAKGVGNFDKNFQSFDGTISGKITLSPEGQKPLGGYLKMAAQIPLNEETNSFEFSVKFTNKTISELNVSSAE